MDPKDAEATSKARKRKMKKQEPAVVESKPILPAPPPPIRFFTGNPHPHLNFSNALRFDLNTQPKPQTPPQIPNSLLLQENSDMINPFKSSFTSLLTGLGEQNDFPAFIKQQNTHVDQLIAVHVNQMNQLKRNLMEIQRRQYCLLAEGEQKATKKLKERDLALKEMGCKNRVLESENLTMKEEIKKLHYKVKYLENTKASITAQLQECIRREGKLVESGGCSGAPENEEQEDVESAHVDPNRVEPILLACRVCEKRVATVMVWPCRHICLCEPCNSSVNNVCPFCNAVKTAAIRVCLP